MCVHIIDIHSLVQLIEQSAYYVQYALMHFFPLFFDAYTSIRQSNWNG